MQNGETVSGTLRVANNIFFKEVINLLNEGKEVLFTINGNSMRPFLSHGDKVLITTANSKDLSFGKVILAFSNYGYVLHRLVWKSSEHIWLAGDNNLVQIEKIKKSDILGYVKYADINGSKKDVHSFVQLLLAFLWFFLRPVRLFIYKIKRLF